MNIPLIMALLAGQHRHRYNDTSGSCSTCGKVHEPHSWKDGQCQVCGYAGCEHSQGWIEHSTSQHRCKVCGHKEDHILGDFLHGDKYCQSCTVCDFQTKHKFANVTVDKCGMCSVCGDSFTAHSWNNGRCYRCGYECKHPSIDSNQKCNVCGIVVVTGQYYVLEGTYKGSYIYETTINGQSCYRQHQYNSTTGKWEAGGYYLVVISIGTPTSFGGDYSYTGSGAAFVRSIASFPINSTLFSGNGRYKIHLKQYSLDGEYIAEGSYTSEDCKNLTGRLP